MSDNLPPGVTEGMIPGNTPEDAEWDSLYDWIAELGMEPSEIRHVLTASQPFMRGGEPVRGTHLRPGDGKWCEYLHNGKICNKCGFSAPAQRSVENAPAESPDLVTAVNEVLAGARRSARGSRDTACVDLTDRWFTSIANWWRVPAPVAPEPAETEEGDRCVMVPIQLLRTEWPPTPQLAPGHKRFDAVYESLLAGAPIREPLTVRYDTWTVIDGHHRITAARLAGIAMVPVRFWTGAAWVPPASRSPAPTAAEPERGAVDDFADALEDFFGLDRREDSLSLAHEIARRYELEFEAPSPPPKRTRLMAHSYSMAIAEGRLCVHCGCPIEAYPDVPCVPCTKKRPCGRCLARLATPEAEGGSK